MFATVAGAQDAREKLTINVPASMGREVAEFPRGTPSTSTGSPIAFGANLHDFYIGAGFQTPVRYHSDSDGGAAIGFGLGDSKDAIGVDVSLSILAQFASGDGNWAGVNVKVHRLLENNWAVAVGMQGAVINGKKPDDPNPNFYGVVSKVMDVKAATHGWLEAVTVSGGVGDQSFRLEKDIRDHNNTIGFFGSAALRYNNRLAVIGDWMQDLSAGVSFVPVESWPLVITVAEADLTGASGVHLTNKTIRPRTTIGAGFAFKY